MVGTKGGISTGDTSWINGQLYSDGDGRLYTFNRYTKKRRYLTSGEVWERDRLDRHFGRKMRVRVQARSQEAQHDTA